MHMVNVKCGGRFGMRALSVFVAVLMVAAVLPVGVFGAGAAASPVRIASLSDLHYLDQAAMGNKDEGFVAAVNATNVMQMDGILDATFAALKKAVAQDGLKYVLVTGDLTYNGEKSAHLALAERFRQFEAETGASVYVINGDSDINNTDAAQYVQNEETGEYYWEYADMIGPEAFRSIYADFGYSEAISLYTPVFGLAGSCSYAVRLPDGYRLIAIDAGKYSYDSTSVSADVNEVGGHIGDDLLQWVLGQIEAANEAGEIPIGMTHWNIGDQNYFSTVALQGYVMDNWQEIAETLADAGMHFVFAGHTHDTDITSTVSDNGETLYNITTGSLGNFPNQYRQTVFTPGADGSVSAAFEKHECDEAQTVKADGVTYPSPFSRASFRYIFGTRGNAADYLEKVIDPFVRKTLSGIEGIGLVKYLEKQFVGADGLPFSLENYFDELLHGGLMINNQNIITAKNIMGVINDISDQITEKYIKDPEYTVGLVNGLIEKLVDLQISTVACRKFVNTYGFGSLNRGGTVSDLILSVFVYKTSGNETIDDDPFMQDVLARLESGALARELIDFVKTELIDAILIDDVLASVDLNLTTFFVDFNTTEAKQMLNIIRSYASGEAVRQMLNYYFTQETLELYNQVVSEGLSLIGLDGIDVLSLVSGLLATVVDADVNIADISLKKIADTVLGYGVLDKYGKSLAEVEEYFLNKYLTDAVVVGFGDQLALMLRSFVEDVNPQALGDYDVTYVYAGPVAVEATTENLRKPSLVAPTFGRDSSTQFNLSWTTKASVTDTDIEIYAVTEEEPLPAFTGAPTQADWIYTDCEQLSRTYYGVDYEIGGLLPCEIKTSRHLVTLIDLQPGTTYFYRVGSAARGWWSDIGTFTTSGGDDGAFTFFHVTDTQAPSPGQYASGWANLIEQAFAAYPDAGFVLHTGDFVDNGDNFRQWQSFFNTAAGSIMRTAIMPVSGNHEAYGSDALVQNFHIDYDGNEYSVYNPSDDLYGFQYTDSGVYYSFDYNNAHFAILNSNDLQADGKLSQEQLDWLTADMNASEADWKFVAIHFSVYSNGEHYADQDISGLRKQFQTLMPELQIDVVFSGHDHVYFRTEPLNNNKVDTLCDHDVIYDNGTAIVEAYVNPDGTIYSVNGAAGVKSYQGVSAEETKAYFPEAAKTYSAENPIFTAITIDGSNLVFRSYSVNGETLQEVDKFGIVRDLNELKRGDANLDGYVNSADARLALRYAAHIDKLTGDSLIAADVNGDGKVNTVDARLILRVAAKLEQFEDPYVRFSTKKTNSVIPA